MSIDLNNLIQKSCIKIKSNESTNLYVKKIHDNAVIPSKANDSDAGYDLYSTENCTIPPNTRYMVHTGISLEIPNGYVGLIWPRSGLAVKNGIDVLAGVVDSGYRGEVCVVLQNHGDKEHNINVGDRVAQILFQQIGCFTLVEEEELNNSDRGQSGFGSTGK